MNNKIKTEMQQPTIVEMFNDDGTHSHWSLVETETGIKVWSENPIECKAQGYPVESPKKEYNGLPSDEEIENESEKQVRDFDGEFDDLHDKYALFYSGAEWMRDKASSELETLKAEIAELKKENGLFKTVLYEVVNYSTSKTSALQLKKLAESVLKK